MARHKSKALKKQAVSKPAASGGAERSRVGKLQLKKGSLGLFAVCEVAADHLIVNHTRNTKGFISLKGSAVTGKAEKMFKIGQLIVASVTSEIGSAMTGEGKHGSGTRKKVQMTMDS